MKTINRKDLPTDYLDMMKSESHHTHRVVEDEHGCLRWEKDAFIDQLTTDCSLNDIVKGFHSNGNGKNTESYRELYRRMGYSLSGYWEIFYWNNPDADKYVPRKCHD